MPVSNNARMIAAIQGLVDELCSPDLTLARAEVLRPRLFAILETLETGDPKTCVGDVLPTQAESDRSPDQRLRDVADRLHTTFAAFPKILPGRCVR